MTQCCDHAPDPDCEALCPLPTFDPLLSCLDRQILDCVGSDLELCLPRVFTNTDGTAEALRCDCFDDTGECGPVQISPDGDIFSCAGSCPDATRRCEIHIDGSSTGGPTIPVTAVGDGAEVTCECTCTKSAPPGTDGWATACDGSTSYDFALTPIPADFFGLGSAPFVDVLALGGVTGGLDTRIQRLDSMCFDGPLPVTQTSAIEIVQLDLVSCEKIIVDFGDRTEDWKVFVRLTGTQIHGTLTAIKTHAAGGTYTADIPVNAEFLFVRNIDGETAGPLPAGNITLSTTVPAPWDQTNCPTGFCPGFTTDPNGDPCCKPTCHQGPGHEHCTQPRDCPACPECTWNNGPPLDDFGAPASQYDGFAPDVFSAEVADDFFFTGKGTNPCDILRARFWVSYFNMPPDVVPDPVAQWRGVTVSIYDDADPKGPAGNRNDDGTFTTGLVATRTVPMPGVVVIPRSLPCLGPIFQIDVNFADPISLEKNHKYWIVFQPNMDFSDDPAGGPGYGQVAVLLSQEVHDHPSQQIFPSAGLPNWSEFSGNVSTNPLCNTFPLGSRKDIAFELFAVKSGLCAKPAPSGIDCWTTVCDGTSSYDFNLTPLPSDFFFPGSDPFSEVVDLGGPTGFADTQVRRIDDMCFDGPLQVTAETAIELVALDLVSCNPITVTSNVGQNPEDWRVIVQLGGPQEQGLLRAVKTHDNGGTYTAELPVDALLLFERVSDGLQAGPIPAGPTLLTSDAAPWLQSGCVGPCGGTGFCPGLDTDDNGKPCCEPTCHAGPGHEHCTVPPDCRECRACGDPATGSCFDSNGSPFCDKRECCEAVCSQLPRCCTDGWDTTCVQAALDICGEHAVERDHFEFSIGRFELILPDGSVENIVVTGPALALVFFEGPNEGDAVDNDGNNLDEVQTEMVSLSLSGISPSLGLITVGLNPAFPSLGLIEEKEDTLTGRLDLPPFAPTGAARSYFDMFFQIDVGGLKFHTITPKRMSSQISHKPPGPGAVYENPQIIELYDENGRPSGYFLGATRHQPNPLVSTFPPHCAIDARQPHPVFPDDNNVCGLPIFGWDRLTLQFNVDPTVLNLQPSDFSVVMVPAGVPPVITNVVPDAASQTVLVRFNRPIDPGHWTCVVYTATGRRWCLGYLPADAGQDRLSNASDIGALINSINLVPGFILPPYATDMNRSLVTNGQDILRLIDLLNGAGCFDVWIARSLPDCPASHPGSPD